MKIRKKITISARLFTVPLRLFPCLVRITLALTLIAVFYLLISFCYIFLGFRRPTTSLAGIRQIRFAAERNWLGPTLISTWFKFANGPGNIILLSSSSSPVSPIVLPDQQPNPLVDKSFQSLTDNPIQVTDNPTVPQNKSRVKILLSSLFNSQAHSNNIQSKKSQSSPSSPRRQPSKSTISIARLKTLELLYPDQIDFQPVNKFPNRSGEKIFISIANLFEPSDTTLLYTTI